MRRLLVALMATAALTACSEVQEAADTAQRAGDTAGKVRDCAALIAQVGELGLDRASKADAAEVERKAKEIGEKAKQADSSDVQQAGEALSARAAEYGKALARGDATEIDRARAKVDQAAQTAADRCGVSPEQFGG